jgi:hypothetical protein
MLPNPTPDSRFTDDIDDEGQRNHAEVQRSSLSAQVQTVETRAVLRTPAPCELSDSGDPRLHRETPIVIFGRPIESRDVLHRQWSRADDTHLATTHVHELR